jgi:hypothetical protein
MIELFDTFPDTNVQPAEYKRLLGYPRDQVIEGRARELAEWARQWYAQNGKPWVYARQTQNLRLINGSILIDDVCFTSKRLQQTLHGAEAHSAILVAASAGPQLEAEAQKLWLEEKPDEYFFLEIFGSAIVEHLVTMIGARLCAWAESHNMAVLPHYSPGYPEWDVSEQPRLLQLLKKSRGFEIDALESGMLRPKKSLLAVFGLTHHTDRVRRLTDLVPCENCSFASCQYRRAPYRRTAVHVRAEIESRDKGEVTETVEAPLLLDAKYSVNAKALRRWGDERLTLTHQSDGTIDALFQYEGSTCSNMGRSLKFHYQVKLGPRGEGYPIREMHCEPAPGDEGHRFMCRYMTNAEHLMVAIEQDRPLLGRPLNDVLSWQRPESAPTCYCEPSARKHKWGLVLETIHYALVRAEKVMQEST